MSPVLTPVATPAGPVAAATSFQVCRSSAGPSYHQLSLADAQSQLAHWIIPLPLKQIAKRSVLVWRLPTAHAGGELTCIDTGALQTAPAHPGTRPDLRADLAEGVLRLHFNGQLLRGYFRLHCLPEGSGQLWQLTPIGCV